MCGIFGILTRKGNHYSPAFINKVLHEIALLSQSRGKDSSGIVFRNAREQRMDVVKGAVAIGDLVKNAEYRRLLGSMNKMGQQDAFAAMGHARLVTNGTQLRDENNQPVVRDGIMAIHNGIIVNVEELWKRHPDLERHYEIDTEVLLAIIRKYLTKNKNTAQAVAEAVDEVFGTAALSLFFDDRPEVALVTNNGSLYTLENEQDIVIFASERFFLSKLAETTRLENTIGKYSIRPIVPGNGVLFDLENFKRITFDLTGYLSPVNHNHTREKFEINLTSVKPSRPQKEVIVEVAGISHRPEAQKEKTLLEYNRDRISQLRRCSKCLLPETFPFIEFDQQGICNYCHNYKVKNQPKPPEHLVKMVEPFRNHDGRPDCLVPYSGGRDSTYTLYYVKKILGMNPVTLTYDWGMVTDLARRNIARTCGTLGVENIIVAADLRKKRENIRKNVAAWLKNPHLGLVPLFMAGDKYFFYYSNLISRQNNLKISFWGSNPLENTDFKTGFAGISPNFNKERIDKLERAKKLKLLFFFGSNYLKNPHYLNSSLVDTIGSFMSRYWIRRVGYLQIFDYINWDEKVIEDLIIREFDWETAIDTDSTWRIGDGTASFYNYIYSTVAGFSEHDTFRSNQIREGQLSREEGLKLIMKHNMPRYENIKWYLDIIGLDFTEVITRINSIPKLYNHI